MFVKMSKKGGAGMKNCLTFHDITKQNICMLTQQDFFFAKFATKSTICELQQSYLHTFGVAQNFQFNGGGFMSQKGGGATSPPPVSGPVLLCQVEGSRLALPGI